MEKPNKTAKDLQKELKGVNSLLELDPKNTELLSQKQKILAESIETTKEKLKILKSTNEQVGQSAQNYEAWKAKYDPIKAKIDETTKKLNELKEKQKAAEEEFNNGKISAEQYEAVKKEVDETKEALNTLKTQAKEVSDEFGNPVSPEQYRDLQREIVLTEQNLKSLEEQASASKTTLEKVGEASTKIGEGAEKAGKKLLPVTAGVTALGTAAGAAAISFESAFAGVEKTVDATDEELAELREGIRTMAKEEIPQSADAIAGVAESAGQLGIKNENILSFTKTMVQLGDATNLSSEEAATALARLANITQMPQTEFDRLGSSIVALGNNLATTESEISNMSLGLAAAGKQVGMSEAEILGFAGALSSVGIEAQAGGSAFSKVMIDMQLAVEKGVSESNDSLNSFAKVAGVSAEEFSSAFKDDAAGALVMFIQGLQDTETSGESAIKMLDDMGITEVRMRDSLLRAAGAGDLFTESIQLSTEAWDENTALATEAEKRYETTESKLALLKNSVVDLGISIGDMLLPIINKIVESLRVGVDWINSLSDGTKKMILVVLGIVAALGPALIMFGKMAQGVSSLITLGSKIGPLLTIIKTGFSSLFKVIMANPVILVIAGIVAAIVLLYTKCEWFRDLVNSAFGSIKDAISNAIQAAKPAIESLMKSFEQLWQAVQPILQQMKEKFSQMIEAIRPFVEFIINVVVAAISAMVEQLPTIIAAVQNVVDFVTNIISAFSALFSGDLSGFVEYIKAALQSILDFFINIGSAIIGSVVSFFNNMGIDIVAFFQNVWSNITAFFGGIGAWFTARFTEAWNGITGVFSGIGLWFSARWQDIVMVFTGVGAWFSGIFNGAWNNIVAAFSGISAFFGNLWNDIVGKFTDIGVKIGEAVGGAFKSIVNSVVGTAENIINGFFGMINGAVGVINKIPGVNIPSIQMVSFPMLAKGGVLNEGQAIMAEAGPELISMVGGKAIVTPLTRQAKNTAVGTVGGASASGGISVENNFYSPKAIDAYEASRLTKQANRTLIRKIKKA